MSLVAIKICELPDECFLNGDARRMAGEIKFPADLKAGLHRLRILHHGNSNPALFSNLSIELHSIIDLHLHISDPNSKFFLGHHAQGRWEFKLFSRPEVRIGPGTTSNGTIVYVDNAEFICGHDCMFSSSFVHAGDNHAIFDIVSGEMLNTERAKIRIGNHVWVGIRATLLSGSDVGDGSIIAASSVVTADVPRSSLVAGVPARIVKRNVSWTRSNVGSGWEEIVRRFSL